jgi:drug/metabolite transporter (DMT)-like permease
MHRVKALGLLLAFAGVALALSARNGGQHFSLAGDIMALGAGLCWAGIVLCARVTALARLRPEMQLMWQVLVSAPVLLALSVFFGPLIRDLAPIHWWSLAFQTVIVVSAGFILWFWLLGIYPASSVASFSFLTPIFGVGLGWLLLNEAVGPRIFGSAALVAVGILLINRPPPAAAPG